MAFGFLIERFDLFLRYIAPQAAQRQTAPRSEAFANWAGLAFIVLGIAMITIAGVRLAKTAKDIEADTEVASTGSRFDLALAVLIGYAVGASAIALYVTRSAAEPLGPCFTLARSWNLRCPLAAHLRGDVSQSLNYIFPGVIAGVANKILLI